MDLHVAPDRLSPVSDRAGAQRAVLQAFADGGEDAVLVLVLGTVGSTWSKPGDALYVDAQRQVGWLSGGCLEPALLEWARLAAQVGAPQLHEIDTRDDADRLVGSGLGCRGRLLLLMLPRRSLDPGARALLAAPLAQRALRIGSITGGLRLDDGERRAEIALDASAPAEPIQIQIAALPLCWLLGCGPESAALIALLRMQGWFVHALEQRPRWRALAALADQHHDLALDAALPLLRSLRPRAVVIASHSFERDHAALQLLAQCPPPCIELLGPPARRDELLSLLDRDQRVALQPVLHAPAGLDLGGRGAEAIALSICARLEQFRHGRG